MHVYLRYISVSEMPCANLKVTQWLMRNLCLYRSISVVQGSGKDVRMTWNENNMDEG